MKNFLFITAFLFTFSVSAETIVVTASKIPIPLEKTANSVTVINSKEIESSSASDLTTLLKKVSGVSITQSGTKGSQASVYLRGSNSSDFILIVDGIQMNDPSQIGRSASLEHIALEDIETIEVMKGSQSVLYGSDAAGGVIAITTKQAANKTIAGDLGLAAGNGKYYQGRASLNGTVSQTKYYLSTDISGENSRSSANGDNFDIDSEKYKNISGKVESQLSRDLTLKIHGSAYRNDVELDDGSNTDDKERTLFSKGIAVGSEIKLLYLEGMADILLKGNKTRFDRKDTDDNYPSNFRGETVHLELQNNYYIGDYHTIATGMEYEREEDLTNSTTLSASTLNTKSIFGLYQLNTNSTFATAGLRIDHHSSFGKQLTYKIAPGYYFNSTKTKLFANYSTSFKSPSLYYLYESAWGAGNDNLEPEKGYTTELGINQNFLANSEIEFVLFYNKLKESIIYGSNLKYQNGGEQTSKGFEVSYRFANKSFSIATNYSLTIALDKNGDSLLKRPKHNGNIAISYQMDDRIQMGMDLNYKGKREDYKSETENYKLGGYSLLGIYANYSAHKNLMVWAKITNLLDKSYEDVKGYNSYGRTGKAGIKWSF